MEMKKRFWKHSLVSAFTLCSLAACGTPSDPSATGAPDPGAAKPKSNEPVTLVFGMTGTEEQFKLKISENPQVKAKFPHVTFEYRSVNVGLEKLLSSNDMPDLINVVYRKLPEVQELKLGTDLSQMVSANQFDLNKFRQENLESIRRYSGNGQLIALPDSTNKTYSTYALAYNKDLFDKFGVSYPKDGMTWDEAIDLGKKLTRMDGGQAYYGLHVSNPSGVLSWQQGLNYVNQQGKVDMSGQKWVELFRVNKRLYDEQNRVAPPNGIATFTNDKNFAMWAGSVRELFLNADKYDKEFRWDIVTFPSFQDAPGVVPPEGGVFVLTSTSKKKEAAFEVLSYLLSGELQEDTVAIFEKGEKLGKHVDAAKNRKASIYVADKITEQGDAVLSAQIKGMNTNQLDINTASRNAQEAIQKKYNEVQEQSARNK